MREEEFRRAAVHVVLRSEVADRDRGVLDVPSRPALAPWAVPRGLAGLLRPPEDEVRRVALPLLDRHARPGPQLVDLLPAELPPVAEGRRVEVHAAVFRRVRMPFRNQALDLLDDLIDVVRRERVDVDRIAAKLPHDLE